VRRFSDDEAVSGTGAKNFLVVVGGVVYAVLWVYGLASAA
jgi:hypothetical protein